MLNFAETSNAADIPKTKDGLETNIGGRTRYFCYASAVNEENCNNVHSFWSESSRIQVFSEKLLQEIDNYKQVRTVCRWSVFAVTTFSVVQLSGS